MSEITKSDFPQEYPIGPDPISEEKLQQILARELIHWKIIKSPLPENPAIERRELYREYVFADFDHVIEFINKVAIGCNIFPHHPRWENTWTTLRVYLTTWDIKHIISFKDIMLARLMDKTFLEYVPETEQGYTEKRKAREEHDFTETIKRLISTDDLDQVFDLLNNYAILNPEKKISNELIMHTASFNKVQREKRMDVISREDADRDIQKIRMAILELLQEL